MLTPDAESTGRQVPAKALRRQPDWAGRRWLAGWPMERLRDPRSEAVGKAWQDPVRLQFIAWLFCRYTQIQFCSITISCRCTHRERYHSPGILTSICDSTHQSGFTHRTNPEKNSNPSLTMPSPSPSPAERMSQYFLGKRASTWPVDLLRTRMCIQKERWCLDYPVLNRNHHSDVSMSVQSGG